MGTAIGKLTGGQAVTQALAAHRVDVVWGIPGTHNLEIYAHLPSAGIRHVSPRHEQGAGFAADGYARVTGRPGVCIMTSGPAMLNAATALGQAYSDSVPVLAVSPGMPLRHPGRGNGELHETKDQRAALNAIVAYSHRVTSVPEIPIAVAQAFAAMTSGRPRPVHLEIPVDVLEERGEADVVRPLRVPVSTPDAEDLDAAAARLAAAARPAILVGGGARSAAAEVRALAERLGAPVVCTINGKGVLPEDHPLSAGAGLARSVVRDLVEDSDVVLVVGSGLAPSEQWLGPLPLADKVVRVDIDATQAVTNAVPLVAVVGDAAVALAGLLGRLGAGADGGERAARWRARHLEEARVLGARWSWILDGIAVALGRDGIVAGDSAMVCYHGAVAALPRYTPASFLYPTGYGTLGYGLPAAIGAKLGRPDARVIAVLGDGGIMFTVAELAAAAQLRLPLPVVVVDNGGYGEIRNEMAEREDPVHAVDLDVPDFAGLGRALGCAGAVVDDGATLVDALERGFAADRPTVLHVHESDGARPVTASVGASA
ncbi:MAG TPA: 5-guanidino-2-oxopentanoate decarboxylase [Baekduia sp.]|nr:5-guanidino-2-oxopentanoate decarboxylase [Baekduia sp.]